MSSAKRKSNLIAFRCPPDLRRLLIRAKGKYYLKTRQRVSISEVIREALRVYMVEQ